jgi:hypothetical protein
MSIGGWLVRVRGNVRRKGLTILNWFFALFGGIGIGDRVSRLFVAERPHDGSRAAPALFITHILFWFFNPC